MGARLRVAITPADVGARVTVRARTGAGERARFTDVVGVLEAWEDGQLTLRRRDGEVVTVAADSLVAGKVVPPPQRP